MEGAETLWSHWHGHPDALAGLLALQGIYLLGIGPLRRRYRLADAYDPRQAATFSAGVMVMLVALVSPLHALADEYLFSAHMVQHVLLTLVGPPLLVLGTPDWLVRPLLRPNWAFRAARYATHPVTAFVVFNIVFSLWHVPALYDMSVTRHGVHIGEHLMFIATAVLMWWPLTSNMPELPRLSYPLQMVYLFGLSVAQIVVFAVITFAPEPLYDFYATAPRIWGAMGPLADQQIGAIIMKVGGGLVFLGLLIAVFFRWASQENAQPTPGPARQDPYGPLEKPLLEDRLE